MATTFNIDGHHVEVTAALENHVIHKLDKLSTIFINKVTTIHVVLTVEKYQQTASAEIKIAGDQNSIFATATTKDLYESIDDLEKKLLAQVTKYHDKLKDHDKHK